MADHSISVPDNMSNIKMKPCETLEVSFTQDVFFWNTDPSDFEPNLDVGIYLDGTSVTVTAQETLETIQYGCLVFSIDSEVTSHRKEKGLAAGHTIQVSSGMGLEGILTSDPALKVLFCDCWPCAGRLLRALLATNSFPIPKSVRNFLEGLLKSGDAAYKLCPK